MSNFLSALAARLVTFRAERIEVVHEIGFDASADDAFEVCKSYEAFIRLMLSKQGKDPSPKWTKGGPGEVGGELTYTLLREGEENEIVERVIALERDAETGVCMLAWEQIRATPALPLRNYGCSWVLVPEPGSPSRCRLVWTRHFDEPMALGLVSLASFMKESFQRSAFPIMNDVFRPYFQRTYPSGARHLPKKTDRVLVVGAGPSGLHMAHLLRTKVGVSDITIVERSNRYGGKTLTVPDRTHEGVVHELGTCYLHPAYFAVRALLQELASKAERPGFAEEVAPINYRVRQLGGEDLTLEQWITSNLEKQADPGLWALTRVLLPTGDTAVELEVAKVAYNALHRATFGVYNYSLPPKLTPEAMASIDMSFGQLLEQRGLSVLIPILAYGQTCQGYGSIEDTPAFWAMCWITPELLDGYFALLPGHFPKKSMLKIGWQSLWDTIVDVDELRIELDTEVVRIERRADGPVVLESIQKPVDGGEARTRTREFDYLVVAAPLLDPTRPDETFLDLSPDEAALLRSRHYQNGQFRTVLYRKNQPDPYLDAHLTLDSDKILGPTVGEGDVFASRDSYLALHPEYCTPEGHQKDPARGDRREQMAYQYVENGRPMADEELDSRFQAWARAELGAAGKAGIGTKPGPNDGATGNYEVLETSPTWSYFQRFDREGLLAEAPWKIMELQGKNRTLFVHASTFFESVLDIVNYNAMVVSGLSGEIDGMSHPESDKKPPYWKSEHWRIFYNPVTRAALTALDVAIGVPWTLGYAVLRPILEPLVRLSRKNLQTAFRTADPGPFWQFDMSHFIRVSPSVLSVVRHDVDPVVALTRDTMAESYPEVPKVDRALQWNVEDYRTGIREWQSEIGATFLTFIGPRTTAFLQKFSSEFPVAYNYLFSWFACISFNDLTGYGIRVEDARGGGCYVPRCDMLATARKEYGEDIGNRICTRVCKVFTEEEMARKGMPCVLEPNPEKGSCMIRGVAPRKTAFSDHTTAWWLDPAPAPSVAVAGVKKRIRLRTLSPELHPVAAANANANASTSVSDAV